MSADVLKLYDAAQLEAQDTSNKILSGYGDLDNCMDGGFREGDFSVITGIPGEGKTTFARMLTLNFAEKEIPSIWFSHEMSTRELWESFDKMGARKEMISYVPVELQEELTWMFEKIENAILYYGVKAVFIDTLGDIVKSQPQKDLGNYATYLAQICKDLRKFAIQHKVMIFAVAHAVKNTRSKSNETDNSDIANSNGIPAAATNIFHIWRDEESDNISYLKIGKSRRDGTKKGWRMKMRFNDHKLLMEGRYLETEGEDLWRTK